MTRSGSLRRSQKPLPHHPVRFSPSGLPVRQVLQLADPLLHLSPWLESDDHSGGHLYFLPGTRVACLSRFTFLDLKDSKIAEFDTPFVQLRLRDPVQDFLHDLLDLELGKARLDNRLGHVFFGHEPSSVANHLVPTSPRLLRVVARPDYCNSGGSRFLPIHQPPPTTARTTTSRRPPALYLLYPKPAHTNEVRRDEFLKNFSELTGCTGAA